MKQGLKMDLHLHSPYSDGCTPIQEIVSEGMKKHLKIMAITDHNTINGIGEFKECLYDSNQQAEEPILGLAGIEISSSYQVGESEQEIHILGYFPLNSDFEESKFASLRKLIDGYKNLKIKQLEMILENIIHDGYSQLSISEFVEYASTISADGNLNRPSIARYLQKKGLVSSVQEAFERFIGKDCKYFLELGKPTCEEVIHAIKAGGGYAVIAHLGEYNFDRGQREQFFLFCKEHGVDGYELFHPSNKEEILLAILDEAKKDEGLLLTLGSDYHGPKVKPNNFIGVPTSEVLCEKYKEVLDQISRNTYQRMCELSGIHLK